MDKKLIEDVYRLKSELENLSKVSELMENAKRTSLHDPTGGFGLYLTGSIHGKDFKLEIKRDVYTSIEKAIEDRIGQIQQELDEL